MKKILLITTVLVLFFVASCGYKFSGGGLLPEKTKLVAIEMFVNNTAETGAENIFANALGIELTQMSDSQVVKLKDADAYFKGVVKYISISALTKNSVDSVIERKVYAVIDLQLVDKDGKILWFAKDLKGREEFQVTNVNLDDMSSRTKAVEKIAERLARKAVSRMLNDF